jgi:protein TonB
MSDNSIEKSFLYLIVISLLLHVGVGALLYYLPETKPPKPKEPVFIDLQTIPVPEKKVNVRRKPDRPIMQPQKEVIENRKLQQTQIQKNYYVTPKGGGEQNDRGKIHTNIPFNTVEQPKQAEQESSAFGLLKQKKQHIEKPSLDDLTIKRNTLSKMEELIKNKIGTGGKSAAFGVGDDIDMTLASFYGRFLNSANSHLKTPLEARNKIINVRGKVDVTFNRKGEIIAIDIIQSGGKIFDDAVIEALNKSIVGSLPKAYKQETTTLPLVYIFQVNQLDTR